MVSQGRSGPLLRSSESMQSDTPGTNTRQDGVEAALIFMRSTGSASEAHYGYEKQVVRSLDIGLALLQGSPDLDPESWTR
jgi:hypothetical protein